MFSKTREYGDKIAYIDENTPFLTYMGSHAFGVANPDSDYDLYGFTIPPKNIIFPHMDGYIFGFNSPRKQFSQFTQTGIIYGDREYDINIFSITKFFKLCINNNPNYLDTLFVPMTSIVHCTAVGKKVIDNRHKFLSKKAWTHYHGFAHSQIHKINTKQFDNSPERKAEVEKYGYCLKFAYTLVRLLNEVEQILTKGDMDLRYKNDVLKDIRRGEWSKEDVFTWTESKIKELEEIFNQCTILPDEPDETEIQNLLIDCLEMHYGDLSKHVAKNTKQDDLIFELETVLNKYRK